MTFNVLDFASYVVSPIIYRVNTILFDLAERFLINSFSREEKRIVIAHSSRESTELTKRMYACTPKKIRLLRNEAQIIANF
jgi:hypothetical protein